MAGPDPDGEFDPDEFIADITAVMTMGLPELEAHRPTFFFEGDDTYASHDASGQPWDFTASPTNDSWPAPVQVPCSIEGKEGETDETTFGTFDADEYILGFLPDAWAQVRGFTYVTLGGRRFNRSKELAPIGLYEVTFRQIRVEADDVGGEPMDAD